VDVSQINLAYLAGEATTEGGRQLSRLLGQETAQAGVVVEALADASTHRLRPEAQQIRYAG
jgi:hypothetical protein